MKKNKPRRKPKMLIVEDEPAILRAMATIFVREGFEVFTAGDGEEGLAMSMDFHPDIIILDIIMPKLDGIDLLRCVREEGGAWGKGVKVLIYTNLSYNEKRKEALTVGVTDFLIKANTNLETLVKKAKEELGIS